MQVRLVSTIVFGFIVMAGASAHAESTKYERLKTSLEDLLNAGYSIGSMDVAKDGDYHLVLHGELGKKAVLCTLKPNGVKDESISKCRRLN